MPTWNGEERRGNNRDHDTLTELVIIVKSHVEAAKIVADNLKIHEKNDQANFDTIRKDILGLQKIVWTATGIIIALDALPKVAEILHIVK